MKEAYQDVLKMQVVTANNHLRLLTMIFPTELNFYEYGLGGIQDNFSFGFSHDNPKFNKEANKIRVVNLDTVLNGEALYYIPSTDEIM